MALVAQGETSKEETELQEVVAGQCRLIEQHLQAIAELQRSTEYKHSCSCL